MNDQRNTRFQEYQNRINQVLQDNASDPANSLTWLFEELLYEQKKRKVPFPVYRAIRYSPEKYTLQYWAEKYGLNISTVKAIVYDKYFKYN